jgi:hypothetical protein
MSSYLYLGNPELALDYFHTTCDVQDKGMYCTCSLKGVFENLRVTESHQATWKCRTLCTP